MESKRERDPMYVDVDGVKVFSAEYDNTLWNMQQKWIDRLDTKVRVSLTIHAVEIAVILYLVLQH